MHPCGTVGQAYCVSESLSQSTLVVQFGVAFALLTLF